MKTMEVSTRTSKSCDKKVPVTSGAGSIDIDLRIDLASPIDIHTKRQGCPTIHGRRILIEHFRRIKTED